MKASTSVALLAVLGGFALAWTVISRPIPDANAGEDVESARSMLEAVEPPQGVRIKNFRAMGGGCPPSMSVSASITEDSSTLRLNLGTLTATDGPGVPLAEKTKSCTAVINLDIPEGYSVSISDAVGYRGRATLDQGVIGRQDARYGFLGRPSRFRRTILYGRQDGEYTRSDVFEADAVWSPCNVSRPMRITVSVSVSTMNNPSGTGTMFLDASNLEYTLAWRSCA